MPWTPTCTPPEGLVRPRPLDPEGLKGPTRGAARRWRRTSHAHYVPAEVDGDVPEQRVLEQSVRLGPAGAVTGWAALRLHGAAYFDGRGTDGRDIEPVPLVSPDRQLRTTPAASVRRAALDPVEAVVRQGVRCTTVERALLDEVRRVRDLESAMVAVDMACAAELTSRRRMGWYLGGLPGAPGVERARLAVALADDASASPRESRTRWVWVQEAGLPRPRCNRPVFGADGTFLGVPDLLDVEAGVVVEFDGADHLTASRRRRDEQRAEAMRAHGLEYVTVLEPDLHERDRLVERMRLAWARGHARRDRDPWLSWTCRVPAGWPTALPLDDRLHLADLRAADRL